MSTLVAVLSAIGASLLGFAIYGLRKNPKELPRLKIQPDAIAPSMHFLNVRSAVSTASWIRIKQGFIGKRIMKSPACEVCNSTDRLECHEVWEYFHPRTQKLTGLRLLCHDCHMVAHIGYAFHTGEGDDILQHFMDVNDIDEATARRYIKQAQQRAKQLDTYSLITGSKQYYLDLTFLNQNKFGLTRTFTQDEREKCNQKIKL
jgi:hypothetical protein